MESSIIEREIEAHEVEPAYAINSEDREINISRKTTFEESRNEDH